MTEREFRRLSRRELLELLLEQGKEAAKLGDRLTETENSLTQISAGYERLKIKLDDKDAQIEKLKHRLDDKDVRLNKLRKRLEDKEAEIDSLRSASRMLESIWKKQLLENIPESHAKENQSEESISEKRITEKFEEENVLKKQITEGKPEENIIENQPEEYIRKNMDKEISAEHTAVKPVKEAPVEDFRIDEHAYEDDFDLTDDMDDIECLDAVPEETGCREETVETPVKKGKFWGRRKKYRRKAG